MVLRLARTSHALDAFAVAVSRETRSEPDYQSSTNVIYAPSGSTLCSFAMPKKIGDDKAPKK